MPTADCAQYTHGVRSKRRPADGELIKSCGHWSLARRTRLDCAPEWTWRL